jgi:hypothetical protein
MVDINETLQNERIIVEPQLLGKMMLVTYMCCVPYIVYDIWFAVNDTSCVTDNDTNLFISLQVYLAVSGVSNIYGLMLELFCLWMYNERHKLCYVDLLRMLKDAVGLVWILMGAVVYWASIYQKKECDDYLTVYMFLRLIVGILFWIINIWSVQLFMRKNTHAQTHTRLNPILSEIV